MPGSEYYDRDTSPEEEAWNRRGIDRETRKLEAALLDFQKMFAWNPDREWTITDIRSADLVGQIEARIKARLYDLSRGYQ